MSKLEKAIMLAAWAHEGQVDKAGRPYILHPLRVMLKMDSEEEMLAAVLHDVVEDTPYNIEALEKLEMPDEVIDAIEHITKKDGEDYGDFIRRVKGNNIAKKIKLADIEDNLNPDRLALLKPEDREKSVKKYTNALKILRDQ